MSLTPEQIRAATALLGMTQKSLSEATGITRANLNKFDKGLCKFRIDTMEKLTSFFDNNGIHFTENNGAEFKAKTDITELKGHHGFVSFSKDVLGVAENVGGEICVSGVEEKLFDKWRGSFADGYLKQMQEIRKTSKFSFKILVSEKENYYAASEYAEYKYVSADGFTSTPFYVYGDRLAMILFEPDDVTIYIIRNKELADAQRKQFNIVWNNTKS